MMLRIQALMWKLETSNTEGPLTVPTEEMGFKGYVDEWLSALDRDDIISLTIFLHHVLVHHLSLQLTDAAKIIGEAIGKSD
jgi:hypothetical protein